jgi:hypothetical protein
MNPYPLPIRATFFREAFPQLAPLQYDAERNLLTGMWFLGGGRDTGYYGAYHHNYMERIESLFPDATKVVHIFSGSMPRSDEYVRIDANAALKPDIVADVEKLSTVLPFRPDLIYADPPYSVEDAEHYGCVLCNRTRVVEECGLALSVGGYLVWLDQVLPVFRNDLMRMVGLIGNVRSTNNRFRATTIFQRI